MTTYLVTGGTGFLGKRLLARLLDRPECEAVYVLVRPGSHGALTELMAGWSQPLRVQVLSGDLAEPALGLTADDLERLEGAVDHVVHVGASYDLAASEETAHAVNVVGTRHVLDLAARIRAGCLHHVSSIAVAGDHHGEFTEDDFDVGQGLHSAYHRTKFEAERLVREDADAPWRVYRPAVIVGDSRTGEISKVDGPYYFLPAIARAATLPSATPLVAPDLGSTNLVPVDYVAEAMDHLIHTVDDTGRTFHLVDSRLTALTEIYDTFARIVGAPRIRLTLPGLMSRPITRVGHTAARRLQTTLNGIPGGNRARDVMLRRLGVPAEALPHMALPTTFTSARTQLALGSDGPRVPRFQDYAEALWNYWAQHLDPRRARRTHDTGPLEGRTVLVTGASSGIGRSTALAIAQRGATAVLVARRAEELDEVKREIETEGGRAAYYPCDLTDDESVRALVKDLLADHDGIDMLVNNAGRSIRRSVRYSLDRLHDFERTAAINYFAPVRLMLALLPHMRERHSGHIVNISTQGVQVGTPRFAAYLASKAALDMFSRIAANELLGDGITFTTVHMPLVRTPMIGPTPLYRMVPAISPERAARIVVQALEHRPKSIGGGVLGALAETAYGVSPKVMDRMLHAVYRLAPESPAAKRPHPPTDSDSHQQSG